MTPANAMRVFGEQVTQLTRALGNLFIPVLSKVLPYVQAFVEVLTEGIQKLAVLLGFQLPTIDYSGLDGITSGANDATDSLEETTAATKELKNALLGIDELNILSTSATSSKLDDLGNNLDLDIKLPEYNFLKDIQKQVDELKEKMKAFLDIVLAVGGAFLAWKIWTGLSPALKVAGELLGLALGKQMALTAGAAGFLSNIKRWIPILGKIATLALAIGAFKIAFDSAKKIGAGTAELADYFKAFAMAALGGLATAAFFGFSPAGWVIGVVAALSILISGISFGMNQRLNEMAEEAFFNYNEGAITITGFSQAYAELLNNITQANKKISESGNSVISANEKIDSAISTYKNFISEIELGISTISEKIPEMEALFVELTSSMKDSFSNAYDTILQGLLGPVALSMDYTNDEITEFLTTAKEVANGAISVVEEFEAQFADLQSQLDEGSITNEEYGNSLKELLDNTAIRAGAEAIQNSFAGIDSQLKAIDWQSPAQAQKGFEILKTAASNALGSIDESMLGYAKSIETLINQTESVELKNILQNMLDDVPDSIKAQKETVGAAVQEYTDYVQASLLSNLQSAANAAVEKWNKLEWWEKIFYGYSSHDFAKNLVEAQAKNVVGSLGSELETQFSDLGIDINFWYKDSVNTALNNASDTVFNIKPSDFNADSFRDSLMTAIDDALKDVKAHLNTELGAMGVTAIGTDGRRGFNSGTFRSYATPKIPSIPMLATGGVITKPTTVTVGEYPGAQSNPEIVSPLSLLRKTIQEESLGNEDIINAVMAMGSMIVKAINDKESDVVLDGRSVARQIRPYSQRIEKESGGSLVH